ncbi:Z1 domain-containing protein [Chryseolinea soli]|uniref:Putative endonuclease Z1 domain-containing protein n=1 Tax=Chryseolinea soli TaxID=2321403 RepID=A0A385SL37_9BACT|nr:Z1 domain-containing protein [Chryseolinea soli]AYB30977.1 hypothetical protein D4L85_10475 [Chryseolinea soli]
MIETNGRFLNETIESLGLTGEDRSRAITTAESIVTKVVDSYDQVVGTGQVGKNGKGVSKSSTAPTSGAVGLIYGRIQSGKTRAMIVSTAMAFDNGFRIATVLTSNINDLVSQTHLDFIKDLRGVSVFTKDDELDQRVEDAKLDLANPDVRLLIVASKGVNSLKNITDFLKKIGAQGHPVLMFDDEGDQASLDTNTYKRTRTGDLTLEPSAINNLIKKLRRGFSRSVYVSVTGTPQAVLLQSGSSDNRPQFIEMLAHGDGYVGGDYFFNTDEPEANPKGLVSIIPGNDQLNLLSLKSPIPTGLKDSILFFLLSGSAAVKTIGFPQRPTERDKGYQFLCHPSLRNKEQESASQRIQAFLTEVKKALMGLDDNYEINKGLAEQYEQLKKQLGEKTPPLEDLKKTIQQELLRKKILVINASNSKRQGIEYGPGFNFLIGGNTLGRGIAIPNLLVTYYVRSAVSSQIDTMHQHARMFGYRLKTLPYTRLFITKALYYRFRDIHYSDTGLRGFIFNNSTQNPSAFPVEFSPGLRATRRGVLDINATDVIWSGVQIYPNYIKLPQTLNTYRSVLGMISQELGGITDLKEMDKRGRTGAKISTDRAIEIVAMIKTRSQNSWHDKTIDSVLEKLQQRLGNNVNLKFRLASRNVEEGGFLSSGTLSGDEQKQARADSIPTLWIMAVTGKKGSPVSENKTFVYPTIVVPNVFKQAFVFSKK